MTVLSVSSVLLSSPLPLLSRHLTSCSTSLGPRVLNSTSALSSLSLRDINRCRFFSAFPDFLVPFFREPTCLLSLLTGKSESPVCWFVFSTSFLPDPCFSVARSSSSFFPGAAQVSGGVGCRFLFLLHFFFFTRRMTLCPFACRPFRTRCVWKGTNTHSTHTHILTRTRVRAFRACSLCFIFRGRYMPELRGASLG